MRLAILASHPIQYQAPLFRELTRRCELRVFFAHRASKMDQAIAGFGVGIEWDVDLLAGYENRFLPNLSRQPGLEHFAGCDAPSIHNELKGGRYDALLVMGWHLKCFWQAIWAAQRLGISVMVRGDSHLATPRSTIKRIAKALVYPVALRVFDAALYVGERSRQYWMHYNYPDDRLIFSPHCIDSSWFAERATVDMRTQLRVKHGVAHDAKVVLFAGKLVDFKRPLDLIEAMERLPQDIRPIVMIAGKGPLEDAVTVRAKECAVELVKLGFCNQTEMPLAYAACDILVLPSDGRETWGLVANEALACGRPVIVSDSVGCAPDLASDGTAGATFPLGDKAALSDAVADMLFSPPIPQNIARKASKYSVAAAAEGVCEALTMLSKRKVTT